MRELLFGLAIATSAGLGYRADAHPGLSMLARTDLYAAEITALPSQKQGSPNGVLAIGRFDRRLTERSPVALGVSIAHQDNRDWKKTTVSPFVRLRKGPLELTGQHAVNSKYDETSITAGVWFNSKTRFSAGAMRLRGYDNGYFATLNWYPLRRQFLLED